MGLLMSENSAEFELIQRFMNAFHSISNAKESMGSIEKLKNADGIILIGTRVASEEPEVFELLQSLSKSQAADILYAHPLEDVAMQKVAAQFMKYEPGAEEGLMALFANYLLKDAELESEVDAFLSDLDLGYLEAESNIGEEEFEAMLKLFEDKSNKVFLVGTDLMAHKRATNIAKLCAIIEQSSDFSFLILPERNEPLSAFTDERVSPILESVAELPEFNGTVIYNIMDRVSSDNSLRGSEQFARAAKISNGDFVSVSFGGQTIERVFKIEDGLKGTIAINPTFDITIDPRRYKFERSQINKINQNSESNNE